LLTTPDYRSLWPVVEWCLNRLGPVSYADAHILKCDRIVLGTLLQKAGLRSVLVENFQGMAAFGALLHWQLADLLARGAASPGKNRSGLLLYAEGRP